MTIFDFLNNILHDKKQSELDLSDYNVYSPYIINRFLSQYSSDVCYVINHTVNKNFETNWDKEHHYKFLIESLPKLKKKFIRYIKKNKDKDKDYTRCADIHEISKREVDLYFKEFKLNIKKYE
tara:strand:+ start:855 stop:1223 length:369 start_codon:yes stop_codon:yes gene_type:complete